MLNCKRALAVAAILVAVGCSRFGVRKEMMAMGPVILPSQMCAVHGTVSMSKDKEGERMLCEMQEQLGTHISRCVCVDEGFSDRERELAMEQMRGLGVNGCGSFGPKESPACFMGQVGVSSALGTGQR
jgi:hypothetical protein